MNRIAFESIAVGRRASVGSQLRGGADADENLDLFSRTRRSDGDPVRVEKVAVGAVRMGKGMEDLLDAEIGKHDYDWLLTPPETPLYPSAVARESPLSSTAPPARESPVSSSASRGRTATRSVSNTRPSRLSTSQTENGQSTRPVRSSSVTRPSISSTCSTSAFSNNNNNNNNRTSVLNTSSASVTSSRPSTPGKRSTAARPSSTSTVTRPSSSSSGTRPSSSSSTTRPSSASTMARSTSTSRTVPSRLPTPTRTRPNSSTLGDRITRPSNNSRPSTPTSSRPQTPPNPGLSSRVNSRSSTPTRRPNSLAGPSVLNASRPTSSSGASMSNAGSRFPSVSRVSSSTVRNPAAPASRPSSPGPRSRAPVRPIDLPDFPTDVPPNLRTKLPERPASAGRTRPGMALTLRVNSNSDAAVPTAAAVPASSNRRNYMPVVSRGRFPENSLKGTAKLHGNNGHQNAMAADIQKLVPTDCGLRRPVKTASPAESTGFGRTISKKSLDMALRHMDIRQGMGGVRASSLFPQSIRSTTVKNKPARKSDPAVPLYGDDAMAESGSCNGTASPDCRSSFAPSENGDYFAVASSKSPDRESLGARDSELEIHGSSRYDAFLLKEEDSKNMNWLHSTEDKADQSPVFDHRFEPLPEPFGLL